MKIVKGQIIAITQGEYSDYCLLGHLLALNDFDYQEAVNDFRRETNTTYPEDNCSGEITKFLAWLIRNQIVEPLEDGLVVELHLGSYEKLNP